MRLWEVHDGLDVAQQWKYHLGGHLVAQEVHRRLAEQTLLAISDVTKADDDYVIQIGEDKVEAGQYPVHHPLGLIAGIWEPNRQPVELKQPECKVTAIFCMSAGCNKIWL